MPTRSLGSSGLHVSRLALGSWRTFERISRDAGLAVMRAARTAGITFLDDARYDDETGTAPIPTGYSEVLFGELFRASGWRRDEAIVSNKLWWEFWPEQDARQELDASLGRMGFEHVDVIYANPPLNGLTVAELVDQVGALLRSGRARAWAIVNWPADLLADASAEAETQGVAQPCAAQLPYSLAQRSPVEDAAMVAALQRCGAPVVASYVLTGGVLTGKYDLDPAAGRATGSLDQPRVAAAIAVGRELSALARRWDADPAGLAIVFALANPVVATVLFGATSAAQVSADVGALDLAERLDATQLAELASVGAGGRQAD